MEETPNTSAPKVDPAHATAPNVTGSKGLVDRARDILMKPKDEWAVIDREPATIGGLYTGYVMILAAIPAHRSVLATGSRSRAAPTAGCSSARR